MPVILRNLIAGQSLNIGLYGAGGRGTAALRYLRDSFPAARITVFDTFRKGTFHDLPIHGPEDLSRADLDFLVIASDAAYQIAPSLAERGIRNVLVYEEGADGGLLESYRRVYTLGDNSGFVREAEAGEGGIRLRLGLYGGGEKDLDLTGGTTDGRTPCSAEEADVDYRRQIQPEDWEVPELEPELEQKMKSFFPDVPQGLGDHETAGRLLDRLVELTQGRRGAAVAEIHALHPIEQLEWLAEGKSPAYCSNLSFIYQYACRCFGVRCRTLTCGNRVGLSETCSVSYAHGHATTEIYDADLRKWVWADPLFAVRGAAIRGDIFLNFFEFVTFFNSAYSPELTLYRAGPRGGGFADSVPIEDWHDLRSLRQCCNANQIFEPMARTPFADILKQH